MLIRFNVGNFLSFQDIQEFSMIAGKVRSKASRVYIDESIKLLKFAAIFGANASGKSNLITALSVAQRIIVHKFPQKAMYQYCKLSPENKDKSSYFEFEIELNNHYYSYGFEVILSKQRITSEWLYEIGTSNKDKEVFVRNVEENTFSINKYFKDPDLLTRLEIYANDIRSDSSILLLKALNQNKEGLYKEIEEARILQLIFEWFEENLDINFPDRPISDYDYFTSTQDFEKICSAITAFGTGITKYILVETNLDKLAGEIPRHLLERIEHDLNAAEIDADGREVASIVLRSAGKAFYIFEKVEEKIVCRTLQFNHGNESITFSLEEESDGTVRLLDLLAILFETRPGRVFAIDEIDRRLHPQLTYKFVSEYLKLAEERDIQLIVTTHESRLLDFELLRKDEIWFVNKNTLGESTIYSLDEYNERFDKKIDKAYLEGRYGGVPIFGSVFPVEDI